MIDFLLGVVGLLFFVVVSQLYWLRKLESGLEELNSKFVNYQTVFNAKFETEKLRGVRDEIEALKKHFGLTIAKECKTIVKRIEE